MSTFTSKLFRTVQTTQNTNVQRTCVRKLCTLVHIVSFKSCSYIASHTHRMVVCTNKTKGLKYWNFVGRELFNFCEGSFNRSNLRPRPLEILLLWRGGGGGLAIVLSTAIAGWKILSLYYSSMLVPKWQNKILLNSQQQCILKMFTCKLYLIHIISNSWLHGFSFVVRQPKAFLPLKKTYCFRNSC